MLGGNELRQRIAECCAEIRGVVAWCRVGGGGGGEGEVASCRGDVCKEFYGAGGAGAVGGRLKKCEVATGG